MTRIKPGSTNYYREKRIVRKGGRMSSGDACSGRGGTINADMTSVSINKKALLIFSLLSHFMTIPGYWRMITALAHTEQRQNTVVACMRISTRVCVTAVPLLYGPEL